MRIGTRDFPIGEKTYVMGILNVTPDSFSDGGKYSGTLAALRQAEKMVGEGADLIDIGGESTRPGYAAVPAEEEISRVVPVIRELKKRFNIPLSVDTQKSSVAKEALFAGADMVNDIWGLRRDAEMAALVADTGAAVCIMHNRERAEYGGLKHDGPGSSSLEPASQKSDRESDGFMAEVKADLRESLAIAKRHGIKREKILLDPGVGFGKTYEQNLMVINHLDDIAALGYPVLLGVSRKSVIGLTLELPVGEREEGTIAANVVGAMKGCSFVRVHDVEKNVRALKMWDAIRKAD